MKKPADKDAVLKLIKECGVPLGKNDIVRAFGGRGDDRVDIKNILRELEEDGAIIKTRGKEYTIPVGLPAVAVVEVYDIDVDGDVFAKPAEWDASRGEIPKIEIVPDEKKGHPALKLGDRALVSLRRFTDTKYEGKVIRRLDDPRGQVMGVVTKQRSGYVLDPANKRARQNFELAEADLNGAKDGDLVVGEIQPSRDLARKKVRIVRVIGRRDDPRAISIIALYEAGLTETFPPDVIAETDGMIVPDLKGREDLRDYPLVTIDGEDARDFDDAVFAEKNAEGYHLIVAIADVSYYVRPRSALDREAYRRGNSTYFPDRVVPMLPEALSNDLCSLRPKENRACMAFHMQIDFDGHLKTYKIVRGLMRSEARLTYDQVQAAKDGEPSDLTGPLMDKVINPLYEAYEILDKARRARGALDLDLPERKIIVDKNGNMTGVQNRARYDSHKLIEEFMILANVSAAQALESRKAPCVYRVHDRPTPEKLDAAREFLSAFDLSLPKGQSIKPGQINLLLTKAKESPYSHLVSQMLLRTQSQAIYHPENIGHFGLALERYAHFTSPIRRYADLLVHRSLIRAFDLGPGGLSDEEAVSLEERADHISQTERTSAEAERSAVDRFTAKWLATRIGEEYKGRINGVTRFGLFVTLLENGADGLVPIRTLPQDYYEHDEQQHALIGRKTGIIYRLGAPLTIRIVEADGLTGSSVFEVVGREGADLTGVTFKNSNKPLKKSHASYKKSSYKKDGRSSSHGAKDKPPGKKGGKKRR